MAEGAREKDQLLERWRELESAHATVRDALESALRPGHQLSLSGSRSSGTSLGWRANAGCRKPPGEIRLSQSALPPRPAPRGRGARHARDHRPDRRGINAVITDAGREAAKRAEPTHLATLGATLESGGAGGGRRRLATSSFSSSSGS